ncbi:hypothetical protein JN086_14360 [Mycolicibacterium austroafricanum]|uniref:LysM domain-containing protein n=1 Tax=Mycolicibacterium austroafricanum TaxID=39687 RepID=A0ABT8HIC4_MYCAO|nr:hypothetical protein [Mycolicibacterium austroafricanum]MDN4520522.1 hypothetical protein [Mycolicibacterium austroafricanum]QRZ09403.1 hypothetical protein JN090_13395 [Mycolicibacterium austroafricanum]QZT71055.1 hypothetical protein JN086_14360 [Mycolicibacterium austroafricanum]
MSTAPNTPQHSCDADQSVLRSTKHTDEDRGTSVEDCAVKQFGVTPWKIIEHIRDANGLDPQFEPQRKQDWTIAMASARPADPTQWEGRKFIGELPTTVYYPSANFGEIGVTCVAPGRYRLICPKRPSDFKMGEVPRG